MNNHYVLFDPENQVVGFARSSCQYTIPHSKHDFKTSTDHVSGSNSNSGIMKSSGSNKKKNNMIVDMMNNKNPSNTSSDEKHPFLPKKVKNKNNNHLQIFNMRKNATRLRRKSMKKNTLDG